MAAAQQQEGEQQLQREEQAGNGDVQLACEGERERDEGEARQQVGEQAQGCALPDVILLEHRAGIREVGVERQQVTAGLEDEELLRGFAELADGLLAQQDCVGGLGEGGEPAGELLASGFCPRRREVLEERGAAQDGQVIFLRTVFAQEVVAIIGKAAPLA